MSAIKIEVLGIERTITNFKGADAGKLLMLFDELDIQIEDFTTSISEKQLKDGKVDQEAIMQEVIKFVSKIGTKIVGRFGRIIGLPIWKEIIQKMFGLKDEEFDELTLKDHLKCLKAILQAEGVMDFLQSLGLKKIGKLKLK